MGEGSQNKKSISIKILNKILKDSMNFNDIITTCLITKQFSNIQKIKHIKKRRKNAYTVFSSKFRSIIKKANPDKKFGEISKLIGQQWNDLSKEEKDIYRNEALKLNQISKNLINDQEEKDKKEKNKEEKDKEEKNRKQKKEEDEENIFHNDENLIQSENQKIVLKKEQNLFFQKHLNKITQNIHNILFDIIIIDISKSYNISKEDIVRCIPFKNKKYKKNAYTIFSSEYRKDIKIKNPKKNFGEISKIVGNKWNKLSIEEKNLYKIQAEEENKIFD